MLRVGWISLIGFSGWIAGEIVGAKHPGRFANILLGIAGGSSVFFPARPPDNSYARDELNLVYAMGSSGGAGHHRNSDETSPPFEASDFASDPIGSAFHRKN
jgi:hypothetical protein